MLLDILELETTLLAVSWQAVHTGTFGVDTQRVVVGAQSVRQQLLKKLFLRGSPAMREALQALQDSDVAKGPLEQQLLEMGELQSANRSLAAIMNATSTANRQALRAILQESLVQDLREYHDSVQQRSMVTWVLGATIVVITAAGVTFTLLAAKGIAVPFNQVVLINKQLSQDRQALAAQLEASNCFVPYDTLGLLGHTTIGRIPVGDNSVQSMTVVFLGVHGFADVATRLSPLHCVQYMNGWLQSAVPQLVRGGGIIDKLLGDGLLVFFHTAPKAMQATLAVVKSAHEHNLQADATDGEPIGLYVGMNTGQVAPPGPALGVAGFQVSGGGGGQ